MLSCSKNTEAFASITTRKKKKWEKVFHWQKLSSPRCWFHFQKIWFCIFWNMLFPLGQEKQGVNFTMKDIYVLIMSSRQRTLRKLAITKCIVKWLSSAFCVKSVQVKLWYGFRVSFFSVNLRMSFSSCGVSECHINPQTIKLRISFLKYL